MDSIEDAHPTLTAIPTAASEMRIEPAGRRREWMGETSAGMCLPLLVANEAGWSLTNPTAVTLTWNGGPAVEDLAVAYDDPSSRDRLVLSGFGHGIVSWSIPFLFRTSPGWNLLVRGPANNAKDAVAPLEGLVETDWSPFSFTMNWKLTRPETPVRFERDEAICMIVPQRRGELARFAPRIADGEAWSELLETHEEWKRARRVLQVRKFVAQHVGGLDEIRGAWEQNYFRGRTSDGNTAPDHQTTLRLSPFAPPEA